MYLLSRYWIYYVINMVGGMKKKYMLWEIWFYLGYYWILVMEFYDLKKWNLRWDMKNEELFRYGCVEGIFLKEGRIGLRREYSMF